nr:bifunctional 23S rRNA (guanine(2069)-N(7))-methyltransferase RlmK/23S rRNA (guanine(2445)-N(2))-methyltransferase RlmL [Cellvibrionaceae bacterium]
IHIGLDLAGESLHKRAYRADSVAAPLKENLAAALLLRSAWPELSQTGAALVDPMCGSATLLIEALMMAADIAPGLRRAEENRMAFIHWNQHQAAPWQALLDEARQRQRHGLAQRLPAIYGYDENGQALRAAQRNIAAAGLEQQVTVQQRSMAQFVAPPEVANGHPGLVVCNPPYGERLGELEPLRSVYRSLGSMAKLHLPGWRLAVFTGNRELAGEIRLRNDKRYKLFNGAIESELLLFDIAKRSDGENTRVSDNTHIFKLPWKDKPMSDGAQMVFNRLKKNHKRLGKWLLNEELSCYRLYDADIPEYASAVDIYDSKIYIQEYAAPHSIDKQKAEQRFNELVTACAHFFKASNQDIFFKKRSRQKGVQQYQKSERVPTKNSYELVVREGRAKLKINLAEYIDTGLFLDHRLLRKKISQLAQEKSFLNLFCYTASATVQAALGGALESVSVDMSNTYLQWANENFRLNNINRQRHVLVREDCLTWLKNCRQGFDLIMLDPPTFSNSKKMSSVLNVQRDHVALIKRCVELLTPGGRLFFSCNLRHFKLDAEALSGFNYSDITALTIDQDFKQNPKIHRCWEFSV